MTDLRALSVDKSILGGDYFPLTEEQKISDLNVFSEIISVKKLAAEAFLRWRHMAFLAWRSQCQKSTSESDFAFQVFAPNFDSIAKKLEKIFGEGNAHPFFRVDISLQGKIDIKFSPPKFMETSISVFLQTLFGGYYWHWLSAIITFPKVNGKKSGKDLSSSQKMHFCLDGVKEYLRISTYKILYSHVATGLNESVDEFEVADGRRQVERGLSVGVDHDGDAQLEELEDLGRVAVLDARPEDLGEVGVARWRLHIWGHLEINENKERLK